MNRKLQEGWICGPPHRSPAPRRGEGARGQGANLPQHLVSRSSASPTYSTPAAASAMAKELRQPRGGGGQVRPPRPGGAPPDSATTSTAERAPPRGGGQGQGRDPARRRGDPRQPTGNHARDRDQGGAGGQQTATAHTSRGDLRTRPHTDEVLTRLRGKTTVPGAPAAPSAAGRDPVRPRIVKNTRGRYQHPSPHRSQ